LGDAEGLSGLGEIVFQKRAAFIVLEYLKFLPKVFNLFIEVVAPRDPVLMLRLFVLGHWIFNPGLTSVHVELHLIEMGQGIG